MLLHQLRWLVGLRKLRPSKKIETLEMILALEVTSWKNIFLWRKISWTWSWVNDRTSDWVNLFCSRSFMYRILWHSLNINDCSANIYIFGARLFYIYILSRCSTIKFFDYYPGRSLSHPMLIKSFYYWTSTERSAAGLQRHSQYFKFLLEIHFKPNLA